MGALRVVAFLALASCAEISGLSQLGTDDGAAPADVATLDAPADNVPPALEAGHEADASPSDSAGPALTYCNTLGTANLFCADFDEQSVTDAYVNGVLQSWTSVSSPPPSLTTAQHTSGAQSGLFDGASDEMLGFAMLGMVGSTTSFGVSMNVRNETMPATGDNQILTVQVTQGYTLIFALRPSSNAVSFQVNEIYSTDAGQQTMSHKPAGTVPNAAWQKLQLSISSTSVTVMFGSIATQFTRAITGTNEFAMAAGWSVAGWSGELDDVIVAIN
ncbi:MAG TPA: hypothetical protein VGH28_31525 [Polyangiaceae bacterium]|jgi:hypothetical protein